MSGFDSTSAALELLVHSYDDVPGDWNDVLSRAGHESETRPRRPVRRQRWLVVAVACCLAGVALVATAFATGLEDRFSAWLSGNPGSPARASVQRAFARDNATAYASFPQGTKLRLLLSQNVAGKSFELLGFQNGDAYCLRLIRVDLPNGIGQNVCLRAAELDGTSAVVAGDARFEVGDPAVVVDGVYGFVADDVRAIVVDRLNGLPSRATVASNVFLSLRSWPTGSVRQLRVPDPVTTVTALTKAGRSILLPYVSKGSGIFGGSFTSSRPGVPSYFNGNRSGRLGGPTRVAYRASDRISWLTQRQPRGLPLPAGTKVGPAGTTVAFGRVIQPDPANPARVGVVLARLTAGPAGSRAAGLSLCLLSFPALATRPLGASCSPGLSSLQKPLMIGSELDSAITEFDGLASDAVASVSLYLADGRVVKAALNNNVFSVSVPAGELPGKLVAFDKNGRPIDIQKLPGHPVITACPSAIIANKASATASAEWERIDLATLRVNGRQLIGATVPQVIAALGKPALVIPDAEIENGVRLPALLYSDSAINRGPNARNQAGLVVTFTKKGGTILADALDYTSSDLTDARLGNLLLLQPAALQSKLRTAYATQYQLTRPYGSDPGAGCTGTFSNTTRQGLIFGLNPRQPSGPYLDIVANAAAHG